MAHRNRRTARACTFAAGLVLLLGTALLSPLATTQVASAHGLPVHLALVPAQAAPAGQEAPLPPSRPWSFGLVLPSQNPAGLAAMAEAVSDPTSPLYGHFLSHAQLMAAYGPNPALVQHIQTYLASQGFTSQQVGQMLEVQGTVGQVDRLFATTLERIGPPPGPPHLGPRIAPIGPLTIPAALEAATGITGLVRNDLTPLFTADTIAGHEVQFQANPLPAPPGAAITHVQVGPFRVTAQLVSNGVRAPGMAVRYLITATLNGQPDTQATLQAVEGAPIGATPLVNTTLTTPQGAFLLDFSVSEAQTVHFDAIVTDGTNTATVPLPAATFIGPDVQTCPLGQVTIICPWNPASHPVTGPFDGTALAQTPQKVGPAQLAVYTAGAVSSISVADVDQFAATFGLPAPNVSVAYTGPNACTPSETACAPYLPGYEIELSLDLQMMESSSPGAHIEVYEAGSLRSALNQVVTQDTARVFSVSYGAGELAEYQAYPDAQAGWDLLAQEATLEGITITVSAGDSGAYEGAEFGLPQPMPGYPANSPFVTAVGGTEDAVSPQGVLETSALWGGNLGQELSPSTLLSFLSMQNLMGGGGISQLVPEPRYQLFSLHAPGRVDPDLSLPASVVTPGYLGYFDGQLYLFGGTSAGAPLLAGFVGDLDEVLPTPLGNLNPALYALAAADPSLLMPVAYGNDGVYTVTPRDNPATGLGQVNLSRLASDLANMQALLGRPGPSLPPSPPAPPAPAPPPGAPHS